MKKIFTIAITVLGLYVAGAAISNFAHNYIRPAEIISVKGEAILAEDESGNLWEFFAADLEKGDKVKLSMYDNLTNYICDDIVTNVEKIWQST